MLEVGSVENFNYGSIRLSLNEVIKRKKISKNLLAEKANLQRTQLNAYCNNRIKRPDFDVLARICYALECNVSDILEYKKPIEGDENNANNRSI